MKPPGLLTKQIPQDQDCPAVPDHVQRLRDGAFPREIATRPELQIPYLILRENMINRIYDQQTGYWRTNPEGMDYLSNAELREVLTRYMKVSDKELAAAIERMLEAGDRDLAARAVLLAGPSNPSSELGAARRHVFLKLKERYQEMSPFKFIIYSGLIDHETAQVR